MTPKQKSQVLTLLAAAKAELEYSMETLKELGVILVEANEPLVVSEAVGNAKVLIGDAKVDMSILIEHYAHLLEEIPNAPQAARILRASDDSTSRTDAQ